MLNAILEGRNLNLALRSIVDDMHTSRSTNELSALVGMTAYRTELAEGGRGQPVAQHRAEEQVHSVCDWGKTMRASEMNQTDFKILHICNHPEVLMRMCRYIH